MLIQHTEGQAKQDDGENTEVIEDMDCKKFLLLFSVLYHQRNSIVMYNHSSSKIFNTPTRGAAILSLCILCHQCCCNESIKAVAT